MGQAKRRGTFEERKAKAIEERRRKVPKRDRSLRLSPPIAQAMMGLSMWQPQVGWGSGLRPSDEIPLMGSGATGRKSKIRDPKSKI